MPARKLIIDADPGIGDAVAMCLALFDLRVEVLAVTAVAGCVDAHHATRNAQAVLDLLDPPRRPRTGAASPQPTAPGIDQRVLHGEDGLAGAALACSELHHQHPAEKMIADLVRANPDVVTILTLGPLTNLARAFQRDPELPSMVGRIVMAAGTTNGIGDVTPMGEFNLVYDPQSAREVFLSPATKTLIPLDLARQVVFTIDLLNDLPPEHSNAGRLLQRILPYWFRSYRQTLGVEGVYLHEAVALMAAIHPELFDAREMAGNVEVIGELTAGACVFDRRQTRAWKSNMDVAVAADVTSLHDAILRGIKNAGEMS